MDELISRQKMKNMITNHWSDFSNETNYRTALACVDAVPTINPEPKRGKWLDANICGELPVIVCNQCKTFYPLSFGEFHNFCPNCGADMREVKT